jgi:hypothetical protein
MTKFCFGVSIVKLAHAHSDDLEAGLLPAADGDEGRAVLRVVEVPRHPVHGHLSRPANHHTDEIEPRSTELTRGPPS